MSRRDPTDDDRGGPRWPDVLAAVLCAALLLGLAGPWVLRSRDRDRAARCEARLHAAAVVLHGLAAADPDERFCTGASDLALDGDPARFGWVADLVNAGAAGGTELLCPANPVAGGAVLEQVRGAAGVVTAVRPAAADRMDSGPAAALELDLDGDGRADRPGLAGGDPARAALAGDLAGAGHRTNYVPSWFLVRTGPKTAYSDDGELTVPAAGPLTGRAATIGPLTRLRQENTNLPASTVPWLGDGAAAVRTGGRIPGLGPAGTPLAASLTAGPAAWNDRANVLVHLPPGRTVVPRDPDVELAARPFCRDRPPARDGDPGDGGMDGILWLQDTRAWAAPHADGRGGRLAVLLMGDGSTARVADRDGDGLLNPGFPAGRPPPGGRRRGYGGAAVELPPSVAFSGGLLRGGYISKSTFE